MNLAGDFLSTAGHVGMLAQFTYYTMVVTALAFFGGFVFFLTAHSRVVPEHRGAMALHAIICGIAGLSYFKIQNDFSHLLQVLAGTPTGGERLSLIHEAYVAIGQFRYMDWTVTTPLLLLAAVLTLRVRTRQVIGPVIVMLLADVFMIATGFIGNNQITADGTILAGPRLVWGTVSTLGYLVVVYVLFTQFRKYQRAAHDEEANAFKWAALATVTTWGVYPLGYLVPVFFSGTDYNWLHIAFSVGDVINKVGIGVIAYWAAAAVYEKRHPSQDNPAAREEHPQAG
ncbi:bacteriorhodopsin [Deinococcus saxicola]|uniref:bacteriorhodopsin n=1 Tax=Deinococcus saxicola TaxID=249406 RepID=UPI0039EFDFC0